MEIMEKSKRFQQIGGKIVFLFLALNRTKARKSITTNQFTLSAMLELGSGFAF